MSSFNAEPAGDGYSCAVACRLGVKRRMRTLLTGRGISRDFDEQLQYQYVERLLVNAVWLVRLRWVAVVGQPDTCGRGVAGDMEVDPDRDRRRLFGWAIYHTCSNGRNLKFFSARDRCGCRFGRSNCPGSRSI